MNVTRRMRVKKGVALIFALFTIAILFSISTTVVALSLNDSRTTRTVNYNDAALHAANWGIEAAINYMGQPGLGFDRTRSQWVNTSSFGNFLVEGRHLYCTSGSRNVALNSGQKVNVKVTSLTSTTLQNTYGLDYTTSTKLGEDNWKSKYSGTDATTGNSRSGSDSRLISFVNENSGENYRLEYGGGVNYAEVEVVCTEFRYPISNQPSQYQLLSVAKVYANDNGKTKAADRVPLATRVVEARVRESVACDFMHFIQNARSWDATGVNLGDSTKTNANDGVEIARTAVFLPEDYLEAGRLRVDGYGSNDPESNRVKKYLNERGLDGKLGFFAPNNFRETNYIFQGDVTTARSSGDYDYKNTKGGKTYTFNQGSKDTSKIFSGTLRDGEPSLGLPQVTSYFDDVNTKVRNTSGGTKMAYTVADNTTWANKRSDVNAPKTVGVCPDIAQAPKSGLKDVDGKDIPSATPTFATVRIEIKGNEVRVVKYNSAVTNSSGNIDPNYVQTLTNRPVKISDINNGVISVTGGNVEVVNVDTFANTGLSTSYIKSDTTNNAMLDGSLTILANVDKARDISLNNVDASSSERESGESVLYSDKARTYYEEDPYEHVPPFSQKELGTGSSTVKSIWPSPASSAIEREGNVMMTSDIAYKPGSSSSLGVVAKNYILLNDKSLGVKSTQAKKDQLRIDAVLMSMDHSVQFDWNNMAANSQANYNYLVADRTLKRADQRTFKLNGAIVSSFLDVEGDTNGRGYYTQKFNHDENLRYNLPPLFPRWDISNFAKNGIFGEWMITAYEDKGAIRDI
ncbi:MAG: hypothetical protein ACI38Q_00615 [Candidatus Bruticola sp.]